MSEEMSTAARETDLPHLTRAIALAASARRHGNHPFGSLLVDRDGSVVLEAENTVVTGRDVTAHAEQNLVREASARLPPHELEACTLYTSTEPCGMCDRAIREAGISRVVYGTSTRGMREGRDGRRRSIRLRDVWRRLDPRIAYVGPVAEKEGVRLHREIWPRNR